MLKGSLGDNFLGGKSLWGPYVCMWISHFSYSQSPQPARMRSPRAPLHVNGRCRIAKMDTLKLQLRPGKMNCSLALLGRCDQDVRCDRDVDLELLWMMIFIDWSCVFNIEWTIDGPWCPVLFCVPRQDSDGSHPEHESHSHSSVSSIPLSNLSTPMEMDALLDGRNWGWLAGGLVESYICANIIPSNNTQKATKRKYKSDKCPIYPKMTWAYLSSIQFPT